jgi:DNA-binding GntR family transcriptional regulator
MTATFTPLPETSTADLVADRLREAILDGTLRPGDRLVEAEIAERFAISRGPVREAIRLLAPEGLVVLRRNRGAVVASPTFDDVLEVYAVRMSLGALALANAVRTDDLAGTREYAEAVALLNPLRDPAVRADAHAMLEADLAFQHAMLSLSELPRISSMLEQSARDAASFVSLLGIAYDTADHDALVRRHERLLGALADGDIDGVTGAWHDHIRSTVEEFARAYADASDTDTLDHPLADYILTAPQEKP